METVSEYTELNAMLDNLFPKQNFSGEFITAENTVKGLRGKVTTEEATNITVCNRNIVSFKQENWIGGYFNDSGINNFYKTDESLIDSTYYPCTPRQICNINVKSCMRYGV